jgi:hypothetical protein
MDTQASATDGAVQTLTALDQGHPYRAVADGTYVPKHEAAAFEAARPLACSILSADLASPSYRSDSAIHRRSALANYLAWLAADDEALLSVEVALSDTEIVRYLATDGRVRRTSHRSRVALRSLLRSFRAAFPKLFVPTRVKGGDGGFGLAPMEDWQWDVAWDACAGFRNALTRRHTRALLLLCRSAGLDGGDVRWVTGDDVERRPGAGLWIVVRRPTAERAVPVLARFADRLEDVAVGRDAHTLISDVEAPCGTEVSSALSSLINRQLRRAGQPVPVGADRMRKAWLVEHVAANVPANTLLAAAGLTSLRSIERLVVAFGPAAPSDDAHIAYELGGVENRRRAAKRNEQ